MKRACIGVLCLLFGVAMMTGCEKKPPCEPGELDAAFKEDPLAKAIPTGEDVTVCKVSDGATHAQFWRPTKVLRATMDSTSAAQDNGWTRNSDNWYSSRDTSEAPKWSELSNEKGKLRIDIKEAGGGAMIDYTFTPAAK